MLETFQSKWTRELNGLSGLDNVSRINKTGQYSIKGCVLRIELIKIWKKKIHSDIDVRFSDSLERARSATAGGHVYKICISLCWRD